MVPDPVPGATLIGLRQGMNGGPLRVLFVGEHWLGSSSRSLRDALEDVPIVTIDGINENEYCPRSNALVKRIIARLRRRSRCAALEREVNARLRATRPDVLLTYKGAAIRGDVVRHAKAAGVFTVNVFPDPSPHAFGTELREAVGEYDLVVSTKPFHPPQWQRTYGYTNPCVFVPFGYNPAVHYWPSAPRHQDLDVVLVANWRPQYHALMLDFARRTAGETWRVGVAGSGWMARRRHFPSAWLFAPPPEGRAYGEFVRRGRIAIAPANRIVVVDGEQQPGDEDTCRTYELAAAHCFFLHLRAEYVRTIFDERTEVPLWDDASELASLIRHYLPRDEDRRAMAARAHARAVPAYSYANRARQVLAHIRTELARRDRVVS